MRRLAFLLAVLPAMAAAEDWQRLDGAGIRVALTSRVVFHPLGVAQDFLPDGRTLKAGSWGVWEIEGDRICTRWPPRVARECATVEIREIDLRLVTDNGDVVLLRYGDL